MPWQQPQWIEKVTQNRIEYKRTYIVPPWTDDTGAGEFRFRIKTQNNIDILSLECRIFVKNENERIDVKHTFYLNNNQPANYKINKETFPNWPEKHHLCNIPAEFIIGKTEKYVSSLAQQVPTLEQSIQQLSNLINERYNYNTN